MSLVSLAWSPAVVVVILAPIGLADDPPEVATKSELGPTMPRCVPYSSSHLECAGSELLLYGSHICVSNPVMIQEAGAFSGNTPESSLRLRPIAEALAK